jgi:hypothetical protein
MLKMIFDRLLKFFGIISKFSNNLILRMSKVKITAPLDITLLKNGPIGVVAYTDEQKKAIFETVESLIARAQIVIRDTWKGWDGENFDDILANNYMSDGPRSFRVIKREDGKAEFTNSIKNELDGFKSYGYEDCRIYIPKHLSHIAHPLVHEVTHFLQHISPKDKPWFPLQDQTE